MRGVVHRMPAAGCRNSQPVPVGTDAWEAVERDSRPRQGLFTGRQAVAAGVSRSGLSRAVRSGRVFRVRPRVYALEPLPVLPRFAVTETGPAPAYVAHVRAALLSLGPTAAASGRTAAALYGWGLFTEPGRTVEVSVPHGRSHLHAKGVTAVRARAASCRTMAVLPGTAGLLLTAPVQTALDCALSLPLLAAVVVCDSALRAGDVNMEQLGRAAERLPGVREAARARRALALADPVAGSVLESVLRVRMTLGQLTGFGSQFLVCDVPGEQVRVDFCFKAAGLVVEVDGSRWHAEPARDRIRDNAVASLGWRVLRFTWADVVHQPERVLAQIRAAVACGAPTTRRLAVEIDAVA